MNNNARPCRIAINAQLQRGQMGGIETAVTETIHALGKLSEASGADDEYLIVGPGEDFEWLQPFLCGNQQLVRGILPSDRRPDASPLDAAGGTDFFATLDCDAVHFPFQAYAHCNVPTIYSPHDLQHLHFPQFFNAAQLSFRAAIHELAYRESNTVVVATRWVARDVIAHYRLPAEKVQVITWAPPVLGGSDVSSATLAAVREKFDLRRPFALYPAATWEHKNHLRVLEAVQQLRAEGKSPIQLICTGQQTPHYKQIETRRRQLGLEDAVKFLGRVPGEELRALYRLARFVFIPTLFEAASAPLFEAWREGVPVACADVTSLPEQAGDAALLFDSASTGAIAQAFHRMQTDDGLRDLLLANGQRRLGAFSWDKTARAYRAVYRRATGRALDEEEHALLAAMNGRGTQASDGGSELK